MISKLEDITGLNQDTLAQLTAVSEPSAPPTPTVSNQQQEEQEPSTPPNDFHGEPSHYQDYLDQAPTSDYFETSGDWTKDTHGSEQAYPSDTGYTPHQATTYSKKGEFKDHKGTTSKPWQNQARQAIKVQNPAQAAIRLILRNPELAQAHSAIPAHLRQLRMPDASVLVQILEICQQVQEQLQRPPKAAELQSECTVLDAWPMMRNLAGLESLVVASDDASQLSEAIDKLHHHYFDQRFEDLSDTLRRAHSGAEADTAKQQLKSLLSEKEALHKTKKYGE